MHMIFIGLHIIAKYRIVVLIIQFQGLSGYFPQEIG